MIQRYIKVKYRLEQSKHFLLALLGFVCQARSANDLQFANAKSCTNFISYFYCFWASNFAEICKPLYGFVFQKKLVASIAIALPIGMSDQRLHPIQILDTELLDRVLSFCLIFSSFYFTTYSQYGLFRCWKSVVTLLIVIF